MKSKLSVLPIKVLNDLTYLKYHFLIKSLFPPVMLTREILDFSIYPYQLSI